MSNAEIVGTNFANRTLWTGDNLDILRGMNSASVDLIYLDPPFNSNKAYAAPVGSKAAGAAFKDTWHLSDLDVAWMGLIAEEEPAIAVLLDATGQVHSKGMQSYLTMMAVRVLEMRRVLKDTGSIYLHCDPTASHYLKQLLDAVFGPKRFRNEITWKRFNFHADAKRFGAISDRVLFYTNGDNYGFSRVRVPYSKEYIDSKFTYTEPDGRRFSLDNLNPPGGRGPVYEFHGITRAWRFREDKMRQLDAEGRIHHAGKTPRTKRYLDEMPGQAVADIWHDIPPINSQAKERVGYPTQKPLALLERIIRASSNEGDIVLDPFAGCATACVAAERLGRQWVGIDLSAKAVELVQVRLKQQESGIALWASQVVARTDVPRRTDIDAPKNYRQNKHVLYGQQEGRCGSCRSHFQFKTLTIDHVVPQSKGGTDHLENLQLLCGHCNSVKGNRPQEFLLARLAELQAVGS